MTILSSKPICTRRGCPVLLQRINDAPGKYAEWRVEYAGSGHYFRTLSEALDYLRKRKFI